MSADSLAAFRRSAGDELADLAQEHLQHDLTATDRSLLESASSTLKTYAGIGTVTGLVLAGLLARRIRQNRTNMYRAFQTQKRPTHVRFADGSEEAVPDITPLLKPTTLGDVATYTLFAAGGVFFGGELGLLTGGWSAKRSLTRDPEAKARIEKAWRGFRADVLRKQIEELEGGTGTGFGKGGRGGMGEMFFS